MHLAPEVEPAYTYMNTILAIIVRSDSWLQVLEWCNLFKLNVIYYELHFM